MNTSKKFYAGIGSRELPDNIAHEMQLVATLLEKKGYTLRSGNAEGADQAFASGVNTEAQIWLPWTNFQKGFRSIKPKHDYRVIDANDIDAYKSVVEFHPAPHRLPPTSCNFMARNFRQVVGLNEPNSEFVICWTPNGKEIGGTSQAMRIAKSLGIQIFNMYEFNTAESVINNLTVWHGI